MKKVILLVLLSIVLVFLIIIYTNEKRDVYQIIKCENNEARVYETYKYFVDTNYIKFRDRNTGKEMKVAPPYNLSKINKGD